MFKNMRLVIFFDMPLSPLKVYFEGVKKQAYSNAGTYPKFIDQLF